MTVKITNDGKEKHQSWTAEAELSSPDGNGFTVNLIAYGSSEAEAKDHFDKIAQAAVMAICAAALELHLQRDDYGFIDRLKQEVADDIVAMGVSR